MEWSPISAQIENGSLGVDAEVAYVCFQFFRATASSDDGTIIIDQLPDDIRQTIVPTERYFYERTIETIVKTMEAEMRIGLVSWLCDHLKQSGGAYDGLALDSIFQTMQTLSLEIARERIEKRKMQITWSQETYSALFETRFA